MHKGITLGMEFYRLLPPDKGSQLRKGHCQKPGPLQRLKEH